MQAFAERDKKNSQQHFLDFIVEFHPLCCHTVSWLQLHEHIMGPVENAERKGTLLLMPLSGWVKQATLVYIVVKIIWPHWCERDRYI